MAEEIKKFNQFQEENQSKEDNRLPYESPKLRKHGTLRDITKSAPVPGFLDSSLGPGFDIS